MTSNTGNTVDLISDPVSSGPTGCATLTDITAFNCATPLLLNKHGIAWLSGHTAKMATVQQQVGVLSNLCSRVWVAEKGPRKKNEKREKQAVGRIRRGWVVSCYTYSAANSTGYAISNEFELCNPAKPQIPKYFICGCGAWVREL